MTGLFQDLRYSVRQLMKSRGFTAPAILTLAIGIGANTSIFSVVNGVLIAPLPFPNASRIVSMFEDKPNFPRGSIPYPNFLDWQRDNRAFEAMAAYRWTDGSITGIGEPEQVKAQRISTTFFPIFGVSPLLGRNFSADEDRRGANPTAMISEGLWKRKFGSDPNVIGKPIIVAGQARTIVGVIPSWFRLEIQNFRTSDIYEPIGEEIDPAFFQRDSAWGMDAVGLLKPGVTLEQARDDMRRVNARLASEYPDVDTNLKASIITLKQEIVGNIRGLLLVLLGAVGFVLLIACVNVANLLLARSKRRQREFSIRIAIGAGRRRLIRQLLTESLVLGLLGGGLGLILTKWGTKAALTVAPMGSFSLPTVPRAEEIGVDVRVLLFTFSISILTGIIFGLGPALKASATNTAETLKAGGRSVSGSRSAAQSFLVIGEVAMALVLLVGAGLMLQTLFHLWRVDPGFDARNVINFSVTPPPSLFRQAPDAIRSKLRQINASMRMVPGIEYASLVCGASPMQSDSEEAFLVEGQQPPLRESELPQTLDYVVGPKYFAVMRIPLLRGRLITEADNEYSTRIALIDSNFARQYLPGQDPVGKHVRILDFDSDPAHRTWIPLTIVGVVGHTSQFGLFEDSSHPLHAQLYRSLIQASDSAIKSAASGVGAMVRFRSPLNPDAAFEAIRKKLLMDFDQIIVADNQGEEEVVARSIARQRFALFLLGTFAGLALLLASIGIYGVLSYLVGHRTQEIGVRMAVGARPFDVLRMILEDGSRLTMIGTAIGIAAALGLTRLMENLLFGVTPNDPATFAAVTVALSGVALFACYIPARRAAKIDPLVALRYE